MKVKKIIASMLSLLIASYSCLSYAKRDINAVTSEYVAQKSRVSVHDPSVIKDKNGMYYIFGSHVAAAKSSDLQSWKSLVSREYQDMTSSNLLFGNAHENLKKSFDWAGEDMQDCKGGYAIWAPDVYWNEDYVNDDGSKGAYMMYYSASSTYMRSVIGLAVSRNIEGPYIFKENVIYSGFTKGDKKVGISTGDSSTRDINIKYTSTNIDELEKNGEISFNNNWFTDNGEYNNFDFPNAIDPTLYTDTDGNLWMCYGSWSGGIFTLQVDKKTGSLIHPKSGTTSDGRMVDSYFGTNISGGRYLSGEGPFIEYNKDTGYYYLYVTYGGLLSEGGYNMRVFRSKSPDGPFVDSTGRSACFGKSDRTNEYVGTKVMGNYKFSCNETAYMACGHCSFFRDDDGKSYLIYHARFDDNTEYHEVRVHQLYYNEQGWPIAAPYEYSGDEISQSGYSKNDMAGTYEFVWHGTDNGTTPIASKEITLGINGKISGDVTGTWSAKSESPYCTINIDGIEYSGYFLKMHDESKSGKQVMTFAATGNNNIVIWGSKTKDAEVIEATPILNNATYTFECKFSSLVLDIPDGKAQEGIGIQQWGTNGAIAQQWKVTEVSDGYYKIASVINEELVLTVKSNDSSNGSAIVLSKYTGADNQLFRFEEDGTGYYGITSKCSKNKSALDVYDWSTEYGGVINQWEYWGGDCQLWKAILVKEPQVTQTTTQITTPPTTQTTVTTTVTATTEPTFMYGDLNDDKIADLTDLTLLSLHLLSDKILEGTKLKAADVNADSKVDIADLAHFKQYVSHDNVVLG